MRAALLVALLWSKKPREVKQEKNLQLAKLNYFTHHELHKSNGNFNGTQYFMHSQPLSLPQAHSELLRNAPADLLGLLYGKTEHRFDLITA